MENWFIWFLFHIIPIMYSSEDVTKAGCAPTIAARVHKKKAHVSALTKRCRITRKKNKEHLMFWSLPKGKVINWKYSECLLCTRVSSRQQSCTWYWFYHQEFYNLDAEIPNPLVWGLLGTRPHSRRWGAGEQAKLHLPLPMARITAWTTPDPPHPPSGEKPSSTKLVSGAKNVGDSWSRG